MILTTANLQAKNLLAGCCLADYGIKYVQALNLGDYDLAECIMAKMRELYFLRKALCRFVPASELTPTVSAPYGSGPETGVFIFYAGTEQISGVITLSATPGDIAINTGIASINSYQTHYIASTENSEFILTSTVPGTTDNGVVITLTNNGAVYATGTLAGGADQWCMTDAQALSIVRKIDNLCGGCCGCNQNVTDDTLPRYV